MWKRIEPEQMDGSVFDRIGRQWMLVTAGTGERCSTMTASWGGLGVLWGRPSATIYIRPQRYTREFLDQNQYFTLSFLPEDRRADLNFCGSKSGREVDKVKACGFTVLTGQGGAPYFDQAELVLVCRKRFVQLMDEAAIPQDVKETFYAQKDYHYLYIGEIAEVLEKVREK